MTDSKRPVKPRPSSALSRSPSPSRYESKDFEAGGSKPNGRFYQYRGIVLLVFTVLVIWLNFSFIKPVVMGAIFAVVLYPLMTSSMNWRISRAWRAAFITLLFAVSVILPLGLMVALGADAALNQVQSISSGTLEDVQLSPSGLVEALGLGPWLDWLVDISPVSEEQVRTFTMRAVTTVGAFFARVLQGLVADIPRLMFSTLIILLTLFFLLIDGPRAVRFIRENSFFARNETDLLLSTTSSLCYSVLVASVVSGLVQALLIGLACVITGTSGVGLIILVTFIASFLPVIGTAPITIYLTAHAFLTGQYVDGFVFLVFMGIVGVSDNFVRPYVLKGGAELHPLVGFVAAFGGLEAIGFYGLFIGPVVTGLFFALLPIVTRSYASKSGPGSRVK